jgi:amino acid transporter
MQQRLLVSIGVIVVLLGAVFSLQGFGVLKGSPMSDTATWSITGPIIVLIGLVIVWLGARRPR